MKLRFVLPAVLILASGAALAAERGVFGFSLKIDSEGFFLNPTLRSLHIEKVKPRAPAEKAGLKAGDEVLEVEGRVVPGAKGLDIKALAEKDVGQPLTLKVKHAGGEVVTVTMVPVAKLEE